MARTEVKVSNYGFSEWIVFERQRLAIRQTGKNTE
jgi:hypothetical protein